MKSKLLEKVWLTLAALGIGVSLFANKIWALSQLPARRNCSTGEDAGYP